MNGNIFTLKLAAAVMGCVILGGLARAETAPGAVHRFVIRGDAVYDNKTHLTWARCSIGQDWKEGVGCEGTPKTFSFDEAQKLGKDGWRVPTGDELATLFEHAPAGDKQAPISNEEEFPDFSLGKLGYWTRTPSSVGPDWGVDFSGGRIAHAKRIIEHAVRLVRGKRKL